MVSLLSLWLPILLSSVIVFVASSIIHMFLTYHRSDFGKVPDEDQVMDSLRKVGIPPGDYVIPCPDSPEEMKSSDFVEKSTKGPVAFMTVIPSGPPAMGASLIQWFAYSVVVGVFAAYLTSRALGPGADYMAVFRFISTAAFMGYALALFQNSIWYKRGWGMTLKTSFDGLVYALLTGGVFGWLWPA